MCFRVSFALSVGRRGTLGSKLFNLSLTDQIRITQLQAFSFLLARRCFQDNSELRTARYVDSHGDPLTQPTTAASVGVGKRLSKAVDARCGRGVAICSRGGGRRQLELALPAGDGCNGRLSTHGGIFTSARFPLRGWFWSAGPTCQPGQRRVAGKGVQWPTCQRHPSCEAHGGH
jgi:hypothetical protein